METSLPSETAAYWFSVPETDHGNHNGSKDEGGSQQVRTKSTRPLLHPLVQMAGKEEWRFPQQHGDQGQEGRQLAPRRSEDDSCETRTRNDEKRTFTVRHGFELLRI